MITIAIIAALATLSLSALGKVREKAASIKCASNMRQWGQAFMLFANDNGGTLPTYSSTATAWQDGIAPYLVSLSGFYISNPRFALRTQLHCPKNTNVGWAYGINRNLSLAYNTSAPKTLASISQPSKCLLLAETDNDGVTTTGSNLYNGIDYTRHKTGSNICFVDGHVEFLSQDAAASQVNLQPNL